jgi:hypothetical protein
LAIATHLLLLAVHGLPRDAEGTGHLRDGAIRDLNHGCEMEWRRGLELQHLRVWLAVRKLGGPTHHEEVREEKCGAEGRLSVIAAF